jgi:vacuolar-type H+-ATPase subunit E/Vma4
MPSPVESLLRRLEREAEREVQQILEQARERAAAILAERDRQLALRRQEALDRREQQLAMEDDREVAAAEQLARRQLLLAQKGIVDRVLEAMHREALERVARGEPAVVEWHVHRARAALEFMPAGAVEVRCPSQLAGQLAVALAEEQRSGVSVKADPAIPVGVVVQSADGYSTVDASLGALLESERPRLTMGILKRIAGDEG